MVARTPCSGLWNLVTNGVQRYGIQVFDFNLHVKHALRVIGFFRSFLVATCILRSGESDLHLFGKGPRRHAVHAVLEASKFLQYSPSPTPWRPFDDFCRAGGGRGCCCAFEYPHQRSFPSVLIFSPQTSLYP